jgi:hypothetical protein
MLLLQKAFGTAEGPTFVLDPDKFTMILCGHPFWMEVASGYIVETAVVQGGEEFDGSIRAEAHTALRNEARERGLLLE